MVLKWKWQENGYRRRSDLLAIFVLPVSSSVQNAYTFPLHWQHVDSSACQGH